MVKKGVKILAGVFIVYAVLVATHQGEFWPFSIYPMFSQAGHPWTRALVRNMGLQNDEPHWTSATKKKDLPGTQFAMDDVGINQNDLANFIHKNKIWSDAQIRGIRKYFKGKLDKQNFLVYKVVGKYASQKKDSVLITYTPYIYIRKDTTFFNPALAKPTTTTPGL